MTTNVDIVNRALQVIGTRTTVTALQLANNSTNEAIQANLILERFRDELLRMAPWDCALDTQNLTYITSIPGTPENQSPVTPLWEKGQPPPPWSYEYQYPVDCLRACWIIPATQTGWAGGVPIFPTFTGSSPVTWTPPIIFKVQIDQFRPVTAAAVSVGGTGYSVGDIITLPYGPPTSPPIGAPVQLRVATEAAGVILTVEVVNQLQGSATPLGGSYFDVQSGVISQFTTDGNGSGASFTLTFGVRASQRVILTNQEFATLAYVKQVTDPNIMDPLFQKAWIHVLGAGLCMALTGDKGIANGAIETANKAIEEARKVDGNEGLTVNDVTPDWIRTRGIDYNQWQWGQGYEWGGDWPMF